MSDNLLPSQRSYCMSRIKGQDTGIERLVRSQLHMLGLRFNKHSATLPGRPDIVFTSAKVAVFIDGDFWHGFRFPLWCKSLSGFWQEKIAETRARDLRNFRKLRAMGWIVIRIWQHQVEREFDRCIRRIVEAVAERSSTPP